MPLPRGSCPHVATIPRRRIRSLGLSLGGSARAIVAVSLHDFYCSNPFRWMLPSRSLQSPAMIAFGRFRSRGLLLWRNPRAIISGSLLPKSAERLRIPGNPANAQKRKAILGSRGRGLCGIRVILHVCGVASGPQTGRIPPQNAAKQPAFTPQMAAPTISSWTREPFLARMG